MTTEYVCPSHGPILGSKCPHCERLEAFENARREDARRDEDREWKRQEEQRDRDAREVARRAEQEEEAWRRHSDALQTQEQIAAEADARARLAVSGVLRASELARSALVALDVGDSKTALAQIDEALATAPTYAWGYLARALVSKRVAHAAVGPALDRAVALALASGAPDVEPLPIGERGLLQERGDALAYALAHFEREADGPARKLLASGLVSTPAAYALSACIPGYAEELLADLIDERAIVRRAAALGIPTDAFRHFAASCGTWDADIELARQGPPHERWKIAEKLRSWRKVWQSVTDDLRREIEWREKALREREPNVPSLDQYVAEAGRFAWKFDTTLRMLRWSGWLIGLSLPCVCCAPVYLPEGATGVAGWALMLWPPILATCVGVLLVGGGLLEAWVDVGGERNRARRDHPALVVRAQELAAARERTHAELGRLYGWLAAAQAVE